MEDRARYNLYVRRLNEMLKTDESYASFLRKLKAAKPMVKLNKKFRNKVFDLDWLEKIEDCIPNLDNIVRNPRKFIVIEEDIVDISLARAISTESVKHLAQHTNMIASVDKEGNVTPNKILNTTKEESYEIYENRFIYTLLRNVANFVTRRMEAIKAAYVNDNVLELNVDASVFTGKTRVFYKLDLMGSLPSDEVRQLKEDDLQIVERIAKLQRILSDFLSSPFAKQMVSSAPVRPPITRTNVILKNPDFKKALVLWQFIESYTKMGFNVENKLDPVKIDEDLSVGLTDMMCMGSMMMEGLIEGKISDDAFFNESAVEEENLKTEEAQEEKEDDAQERKEDREEKDSSSDQENADESTDTEGETAPELPPQEDTPKEIVEATDQQTLLPDDEEEEEIDQEEYEQRNLFQRTSEETTLTKAEIGRINKAIDRVLLAYRIANAEASGEEARKLADEKRMSKEDLLKKLERDRDTMRRAMEKRAEIARRERASALREMENQRKRLEDLEAELKRREAEIEQISLDARTAELQAQREIEKLDRENRS